MSFVHLHNHSEYSLLDGASKLPDILEKAKKDGMNAVALTDHGNMFGALEFYKLAKKIGIKPIIGFEGYLSPESMDNKQVKGNYHITLLAKNEIGYKNLLYLTTMSFTRGFYYKPRIDKQLLREHSEGIIAGSACLHGEIQINLLNNDYGAAKKALLEYKEIFGGGNFFLEIMRHGLEDQIRIEKDIIRLSEEMDVPLVATNDCHYLNKEDAVAQDALLCIQTNRFLSDTNRMHMGTQEFYFKTQEEMSKTFEDYPEFVSNSQIIADMIDLNLDIGTLRPPHYKTEDGTDEKIFLRNLANEGLKKRLNESHGSYSSEEYKLYRKRLDYEIGIIEQMDFSGYFLIVWDFINYAKKKKIPVGPGRGSAAGSLVSYAVGITDLDPIKYHLLFERFLNPERVTMPDIDVDFCVERRDEVIKYVKEKYGEYNVAQVITFGTMAAKAVTRDVARVMGFQYKDADKIAKMIPDKDDLNNAVKDNKELKQLINSDEQVKKLFKTSKTLEGVKRHASTHAAGIVISTDPIYERCPIYKPPGVEDFVTQFSKEYLEDVGLIKFDFLGLRNLTVIDLTVKSIGNKFDLTKIPLDDKATYKMLQSGRTLGVFQLESDGMQRLIVNLKPEHFEDLIALVALYRPGPLGSGMVQDFIERKHGRKKVEFLLPELENILKETYGIILYQEQVMQIASKLAGYSLGEADILRRAMGKKKLEVMEKQRQTFVERSVKNNINKDKADYIFELMMKFAEYGFNKSHSAAYAYIAYQTAYLKTHYPAHFLNALLTSEKNNTDKIVKYIEECKQLDIKILPPDINESFKDFTVIDRDGKKVIRFGLGAIKNVGEKAIENIIEERDENGYYVSVFDFLKRINGRKTNKKVLESLIKSGCFDSLGINRAKLSASLDTLIEWTAKVSKRSKKMGSLFGNNNSIEKNEYPELSDAEDMTNEEKLKYEKELLGIFITSNPLENYKAVIYSVITATSKTLCNIEESDRVIMAGTPTSIREVKTKRKATMAFIKFMDMDGTIDATIFPKLYEGKKDVIESNDIFILIGNVDKTGDKSTLLAQDIIKIKDIENYIESAVIDIENQTKDNITKIKHLLEGNKGKSELTIKLRDENKVYWIKTLMQIKPSETLIKSVHQMGMNIHMKIA